jgi:hypothetical protein
MTSRQEILARPPLTRAFAVNLLAPRGPGKSRGIVRLKATLVEINEGVATALLEELTQAR